MLDFFFATPDEISRELAARLRQARLIKGIKQDELAARAGLSRGTVAKLEATGACTLDTLIRVATVLDFVDNFQSLFEYKVVSVAAMEAQAYAPKQRVRSKKRAKQ